MTLLAAYNFDEASGPVLDVTGNGHDFPLTGALARTAGHTDQGLTQTSGTAEPGPEPGFALTDARTLMMWIKSTAEVADGRIFEHVDDSGESVWEVLLRSGLWHVQAWNASTFGRATIARPTDSDWHHLAATYDGTDLMLYVDGELVDSAALAGPLRDTADTLHILNGTGNSEHTIDDLRAVDEALDQATIATLMATPVTSGPAEITGTGAFTSPSGAVAGAGAVAVAGTAALTSTAADLAGVGTVLVDAAAAFTAPAGQLAAAATLLVAGTAALTSAPGELTATGDVAITGTAAFTSPAGILAGTDQTPHDVVLTASLGVQDSPTASLGTRRWTATLGSQP